MVMIVTHAMHTRRIGAFVDTRHIAPNQSRGVADEEHHASTVLLAAYICHVRVGDQTIVCDIDERAVVLQPEQRNLIKSPTFSAQRHADVMVGWQVLSDLGASMLENNLELVGF
jgi:hypothetical protein